MNFNFLKDQIFQKFCINMFDLQSMTNQFYKIIL